MVIAVGQRPERVYENSDPEHPSRSSTEGRYGRPMTTTVHQVAAALRSELPGLPDSKLRRLLYYCQAHHLALTGQPMFDTHIVADPDGPAPAVFPYEPADGKLSHDHDLVLLSVIGRYGRLTANDIGVLSRGETPWEKTADGAIIDPDKMRAYFTGAGAPDDTDPRLTDPGYRAHLVSRVRTERGRSAPPPDNRDRLAAWAAGRVD